MRTRTNTALVLNISTTWALVALALVVGGCKPKIPEEYKDLIPEAERENLDKVIPPSGGGGLDAPSLMVWYNAKKTTAAKVGAAYEKQFESKGYERLTKCEQKDDSVDHLFGKMDGDTREVVQFSAAVLTATTLDGRLVRSKEITGLTLSDKRACEWTDFAKKFCYRVDGKYCSLKK